MADLKRQIAMSTYEVDPQRVADAIVGKMLLVRRARLALDDLRAGRSRPGSAEIRPQR